MEGRSKKAAKPQGLMFGTTERFESRLGWSNQQARDEARFAQLNSRFAETGGVGDTR